MGILMGNNKLEWLLIPILSTLFISTAFCDSDYSDLKCHDCFGLEEDLGGEFNCLFPEVKYGRCPKESKKKAMCLTIIPKNREDAKYFRRGCYLVDHNRTPGCWHHRSGTKSYISGISDVDSRICICEKDLCNNVDYSKRWAGLLSDDDRGNAKKEREDFPIDIPLDEEIDDAEGRRGGKKSASDIRVKMDKILIFGPTLAFLIIFYTLT